MSSNDLLSYSIMNGGHKVGNLSPLHLPAINSLPASNKIVLPSIKNLSPPNYNLTESNLSNFNYHYHHNQGARTPQPELQPTPASSSYSRSDMSKPDEAALTSVSQSNSVRSMSSVSDSSSMTSSPPPSSSALVLDNIKPKSPAASGTSGANTSGSTNGATETGTKRRQRLGPSCDSCRSRKVKCNAEIIILANDYRTFNLDEFKLTPAECSQLVDNESVRINDEYLDTNDCNWYLIISGDKLIKFKSCKSCHLKRLPCKFSKGFTKEDILVNKKNLKFKIDKSKNYKIDNSRKSSCFNCRKRKIKCSISNSDGKCDNCSKKNCPCNFN